MKQTTTFFLERDLDLERVLALFIVRVPMVLHCQLHIQCLVNAIVQGHNRLLDAGLASRMRLVDTGVLRAGRLHPSGRGRPVALA